MQNYINPGGISKHSLKLIDLFQVVSIKIRDKRLEIRD